MNAYATKKCVSLVLADLERGDAHVGAQHEEAVEPRIGLELGAIDDKAVAVGRLQEAAEALVADERLVALGELALETGDQRGARRSILFGFLLVAADDIAPSGDLRLFDCQFGLAFLAGDDEGTMRPSSSMTSARTSRLVRSRTPRM